MQKDQSVQILSDITVFNKYAKYVPELKRRESWEEIVDRNCTMHMEKYPLIQDEIKDIYENFVKTKKVLPSMRSMQFAGKPIELSPNRMFNCAYLPIDDWRAFGEIMHLLLGGSGVGYGIQRHQVEKLPEIRKPHKTRRFLVGDSIEGWADAVKYLMKSYFQGGYKPLFDFRDIRPKGSRLITSGGKAPGSVPLKKCLMNIEVLLESKQDGDQLEPIEVHDIVCYIADAVLAGGIRRAALIALFSFNDQAMLTSKFGKWWELNPQRGRANNTAVIIRNRVKKKDFIEMWEKVKASGSGEPGLYFSNDKDSGINPCAEIALKANQFCNLTEINVSDIESQEDLDARAKAAAFIGTLQAGYTDFHYLRPVWKRTTEKEALIGVGMTGIASGNILGYDLRVAATIVKEENKRIAKIIGIKPAARTTTIKPSGTSSCVLGSSSGIHAWHSPFYIRRFRVMKNEPIYQYLIENNPELVADEYFEPGTTAVIEIPQKAPENAILRSESAIDLLERVKKFYLEWVQEGHIKGYNTHNVSATISLKEDEWDGAGVWMWKNRDCFNGLSVLPYDGGSYIQAPFEEITEKEFKKMSSKLGSIDLTQIIEEDDETDLKGELACVGGSCEVV